MFGFKFKISKKNNSELKIFIVEDSTIYLQTLKSKLIKNLGNNVKVKGYTDSNLFLEEINENPQIIIMDFYLGKESLIEGVELITKIKKNYPNTFLIVLTGEENIDVAKKCFDLGVDSYLVKTLSSIEKIVEEIQYKINLFKKV